MKILFWVMISLVFYCYLGYPLLLILVSKYVKKTIKKGNKFPTVTIIISVCNEEKTIEHRLRNLFSLDYPREKLKIIIGSDGSTDRTNEIVRSFDDSRIFLIEKSQRRGKIATLNTIVPHADSEILVFADARQFFSIDALRELVSNFSNPKVGCVSGELVFSKQDGATGKGINLYWEYEKFIRSKESQIHSMLGATGAIYAIRRELYTPAPENTVLDDVFIPLKIIEKGYRAIFDEKARAYDEVADNPGEEYRRKVRTLSGNYQIFGMFAHMFNPFQSPIAIQMFSHKFLRVLIPFFMMATFIINLMLIHDPLFRIIITLQVVFYFMATLGLLLRYQKQGVGKVILKVCYIPYVFCLLNFSAFVGFLRFITSKQEVTWEKARGETHFHLKEMHVH